MTQLLKDIFQQNNIFKNASSVLLWDEVVTQAIKKHTKALKVQRGTLHVLADSSVWANELNFLKKDIIVKINEKAGEKIISDIRFKVGGIE